MVYSNVQSQIVNVANLYANGGKISYATSTTLSVAAGLFRDSTDYQDINLGNFLNSYGLVNTSATATILNFALSGKVNGLDTGTIAANTVYYIYAISDQSGRNVAGVIASLTSPAGGGPLMPAGSFNSQYSNYRHIGFWLTASGSAVLNIGYMEGTGKKRQLFWDTAISVLSAGSATTATEINLTTGTNAAVPAAANMIVTLNVDHTPASAGGKVTLVPHGSVATVASHVTGSVASQPNSGQLIVFTALDGATPANAAIDYFNSAASGSTTVWVQGFEFSI